MKKISQFLFSLCFGFSMLANAQVQEVPDQLIKRLSTEIIDAAKTDKEIQAGNRQRINDLVEHKVLPHVNFDRMTSLAVGKNWRAATPEQQKQLINEFRTLLIHTYSGAITQIRDQKVEFKPFRAQLQRLTTSLDDHAFNFDFGIVWRGAEGFELNFLIANLCNGTRISMD